ncbi:MAG: rRNA maturation RNase YbeY [Candidatus Andersenbacteria bacterium]
MAAHQLKINDRVGTKAPTALLERILKITLAQVGKKFAHRPTETSLVFVSDSAMRQLNQMYRGKHGTTNVLSFSFVRPPNRIGVGQPLLLGEVLISPKQAAKDARQSGTSLGTEFCLLFLHGLLHVLQFDHEAGERQRKAMQRAEERVIAAIPTLKKAAQGQGLLVREFVYPSKRDG